MTSMVTLNDSGLEPTPENVPALAMSMTHADCDFIAGRITCSVSGVVFSAINLVDHATTFGVGAGGGYLSGVLPAPDTKDMLIVHVYEQARNDTAAILYGDPTSNTYSFFSSPGVGGDWITTIGGANDYITSVATRLSSTNSAANLPNAVLATSGKFLENTGYDYAYDEAMTNGITSNEMTQNGGTIAAGISSTNLIQNMTLPSTPASATKISGMYMFFFENGIPGDIEPMLMWMAHNHGKLPSSWKGL